MITNAKLNPNISIVENCIYVNGKIVSNFTISKLDENTYELNNGKHKAICKIEKRNLYHFRIRTLSLGNYMFEGNTKELNLILDSLVIEKREIKETIINPSKAIVFTGKRGSGKTYTSQAISNFFQDKTLFINRCYFDFRRKNNFDNYNLIVVDECQNKHHIISFEKLRLKHPKVNFIFCTQKDITNLDESKYWIVKCNFNINN